MKAGYQTIKSRIMVAVLSVLMIFGSVFSPLAGAFNVYAASETADSWSKLKSIISKANGSVEIEIGEKLVYDGTTIKVPEGADVTLKGNGIIYRDKKVETLESMFTVDGKLTLSEGVKLSGLGVDCADLITAEPVEIVEEYTPQIAVGDNYIIPVKLEKDVHKDDFTTDKNGADWRLTVGKHDGERKEITLDDAAGKVFTISTKQGGDEFFLVGWDEHDISASVAWIGVNHSREGIDGFAYFSTDEEGNLISRGEYDEYVKKGNVYYDNGKLKIGQADPAKLVKLVKKITKSHFTVDGLEGTFETKAAAEKAIADENKKRLDACKTTQGCDSSSADNNISAEMFIGTEENPRGLFAQVSSTGELVIDGKGVSLENYVAGARVKYTAPVVVDGGKFELKSGSIQHNNVGYSADNTWIDDPANNIGKEKQGQVSKWNLTDTAGAVILTGGAQGAISGGKITDNRADTGAIVVQGASKGVYEGKNSVLNISGGEINDNVGVHHAGAIYIFNGGYVEMVDGKISGNFAWNKGGAIWASEEQYASLTVTSTDATFEPAGEATFYMKGGELSGNMAVNRGGAINVMSNHVVLEGGKIINNKSRVLGGAIYVEGDGPSRSYRLYVMQGDVTENKAVNPNQTPELQWTIKNAADCENVNEISASGAGNNIADRKDFNNYVGHGGGLWLCPLGGNAAISANTNSNYEVFIGNNAVSGTDDKWGDPAGTDVLVRPFRGGKVNGVNIIASGNHNAFVDESNNNQPVQDETQYTGKLALKNTNTNPVGKGVLISGNIAANGGGIASNGTVMFGKPEDIILANAKFEVTKKWSAQLGENTHPITIEAYAPNGDLIDKVTLNGTADSYVEAAEELGEDQYGENTTAFESRPWVALFGVPLSAVVGDGREAVAKLEVTSGNNTVTIDPTTKKGLQDLYDTLKADSDAVVTVKDWKIKIVEKGKDDKEKEYKLPYGDVVLDTIEITKEEPGYVNDSYGNPIELTRYTIANIDMEFENTVGNDAEPSIEKYVNEAVHKPIKFDEVFNYDILAYVTMDADKVVITDPLNKALEFAESAIKVADLGEIYNNHKVNNDVNGAATGNNGTVATEGTPITGDAVEVKIDKASNTLTVTLDDEVEANKETGKLDRKHDTVKNLRGHWVKVSFSAQLNSEWRKALADGTKTIEDLKKAYGEEIKVNTPVDSDEAHQGVENKASYEIQVANKSEYNEDSNTVTVAPKEYPVKIKKTDLNGTELPGAKIEVRDKNGNLVKDGEWTSTTEAHELQLLPGDYTLKEVVAPKGFQVITEVKFTVGEDGKVIKDSIKVTSDAGKAELDENGMIILKDAPQEEPEIVKYVNPVSATGDAINDTVHTDLSAFDEVFRYDIQAYITNDASYVIVEDQLKSVLEFADMNGDRKVDAGDFTVVVKDNKSDAAIPTLSSADGVKSLTLDKEYSISAQDLKNNKLVLEMGTDSEKAEKLDKALNGAFNGKWLQITFNAKIKDDYRSIEAIKAVKDGDVSVWFEETKNAPVEEPDNNKGEDATNHDGIENDSTYKVRRAGIAVDNNPYSEDKSNEVTVKPETTSIKIEKTWDVAGENKWPEDTGVVFAIYAVKDGKEEKVDIEEAKLTLTAETQSRTIDGLPKLEGVTYTAREVKVVKGSKLAEVKYLDDAKKAGEAIIDTIKYIVGMTNNALNGAHAAKNTLVVPVKISKTDLGGEELEGAQIELTGPNGYSESWESEAEAHELELAPGEYEFVEKVAPEGYQTVTTTIKFEVKEDGTVELKTATEDLDGKGEIDLINELEDPNHIVLKDSPEKPAIEKYVNKKVDADKLEDQETGRDETVHTDLSAFDEIYTYDIQAYITPDAKFVEVNDELREVLEFAGAASDVRVAVKDGEGDSKAVAPLLTKPGTVLAAADYAIDADAWKEGRLVLTMGSDAEDAKALYPNGKWLQITFDAKIKSQYKSIEALKTKGVNVWTTINENEPIDAPDAVDEFSGATGDAHEGIVNDSYYNINKINSSAEAGLEVDNEWQYTVRSNTVTVQPKSKEVTFSKTDLGGNELEGATIKVVDSEGNVIDEWTSTKEDHVLNLADGDYTMIEVVAPEGYQKVTTEMGFKVDVENDKVTLTTVEVNNGGKLSVVDNEHIILEDAPEKPAIEKYVNKKTDDLADAERDGTVHTDLGAFDEVYTYDIQAYITADAKYVEVTDDLKSVLEFVGDGPVAVVAKDGEGESKAVAPKLTKEGEAVADYAIDADAWKEGRLVLTMGSDAEDAKALYPNGKWLQITFDARIKSQYKSIEALKAAGADVWTEITENNPIDDADVSEIDAFSGAEVGAHAGIVNDASYRMKSIVAGLNVDNDWAYAEKSNTVTVQPEAAEVYFSKTDLEGTELPGAKMKLTDAEGNVIDEWTSTEEDHVLTLADGEYVLTEEAAPEGYQCVTTKMRFVVKDGEVTLLTAEVDNGGQLLLMVGNTIVLADAPKVQEEYEPKVEEKEVPPTIVEEPEKEVEKELPPEEVKSVKKIVKTGDDSMIYIWMAMMLISASIVAIVAIRRRRTN